MLIDNYAKYVVEEILSTCVDDKFCTMNNKIMLYFYHF